MNTKLGYTKLSLSDINVLLSGGGHKSISDFTLKTDLINTLKNYVLNTDSRLSDNRYPKFANGTWYLVGDNAYIGDYNIAGSFCIKGSNG